MRMFRRYCLLILMMGMFFGFFGCGSAEAFVVINEVMYDPSLSEYDTEWIELYNNSDTAVDIGGWHIYGESGAPMATLPFASSIDSFGYYLIADDDDNGHWPAYWPEPDYAGEELTLKNDDFGVRLITDDGIWVDTVGWGDGAAFYEGAPAEDVPENQGYSLSRYADGLDTNNNFDDFTPVFPSTPKMSNMVVPEPSSLLLLSLGLLGMVGSVKYRAKRYLKKGE